MLENPLTPTVTFQTKTKEIYSNTDMFFRKSLVVSHKECNVCQGINEFMKIRRWHFPLQENLKLCRTGNLSSISGRIKTKYKDFSSNHVVC